MIGVAALWIAALLLIGGFALDRVLSRSIVDSFDNQLVFVLNSMIASDRRNPLVERPSRPGHGGGRASQEPRQSSAHRLAEPANDRRCSVVDCSAPPHRRLRARPRAVTLDRR